MLFIWYPRCSTCVKAHNYLKELGFNPTLRDIVLKNPTKDELKQYLKLANIDINKAFNTSGLVYKDLDLKNKLPNLTFDEKLELLASNGKLIKRPIVVTEDTAIFGFKKELYDSLKK